MAAKYKGNAKRRQMKKAGRQEFAFPAFMRCPHCAMDPATCARLRDKAPAVILTASTYPGRLAGFVIQNWRIFARGIKRREMHRFLLPLLTLLCLSTYAISDTPDPAVKTSQWQGFEKLDFQVAGRAGLLVKPEKAAEGNPWIWRTEFFGHEPQGDLALLAAGWHVAYFKVSNMYGSPESIDLMEQFYEAVTGKYGLNHKVVLEGFSRGGLYAVNFAAAHPDETAALYLDAPVLDLRSWPGGKGAGKGDKKCWEEAMKLYGLTEETAAAFKGNPLDHIEPLAKAGIPIIAVVGDADKTVPYPENTAILEQRYKALGGKIEVIVKPGGDHHPHSLKDPKPIVDFLLANAYKH
jgi:pimeloyl-ACP methyl ester carboxylesterase